MRDAIDVQKSLSKRPFGAPFPISAEVYMAFICHPDVLDLSGCLSFKILPDKNSSIVPFSRNIPAPSFLPFMATACP